MLFRSVAEVCGSGVLGVSLTGMGGDGARGATVVRQAGGSVIAQDQATSVVWGMPGTVVAAGQADEVLALGEIGPAIVRSAAGTRIRSSTVTPVVAPRTGSHV